MEGQTSFHWPGTASSTRQPAHLRPGARASDRVGTECSAPGSVPLSVHRDGQTLRVVGEVDLATCHILVAGLNDLVANSGAEVAVDCSSVTFFGAVGVDALVRARNQLPASRRLVVRNPSAIVGRVLDILHLTDVFADVSDDEHHPT